MPTKNRRFWVEQSLVMFAQQTYKPRELIIIDDGDDGLDEVCKGIPNVVYEHVGKVLSVGEKRNIACEISSGEYIIHWDDDDIQHVDRINRQISFMRERWWLDACGADKAFYIDERDGSIYSYRYCLTPLPPFVLGNSLCFIKDFWRVKGFEHVTGNEDMRFQFKEPRPTIGFIHDSLLVGRIIAGNRNTKDFTSPVWTREDLSKDELIRRMGE